MAEWTGFYAMLDDVARFARANRQHRFLWADKPGESFGIVAFIEGHPEDEQIREWTLPLAAYRETCFRRTEVAGIVERAMQSAKGKQQLLETLVAQARRFEVTRTRWDIIGGDGDDL